MPKSVMRTSPSSSIRTLAGLRSRCRTPCACAAARPGAQLTADVDDLLGRQPADALEQRGQILSANQLHRVEDRALGLADVEDAADGRMRDLPGEPDFVEDAVAHVGAGGMDHLQRDRRLEHEIVGAPDVAHAAAADPRDHPIAAGEHLARGERIFLRFRRLVCRKTASMEIDAILLPKPRQTRRALAFSIGRPASASFHSRKKSS